jgi:hypothetical protein
MMTFDEKLKQLKEIAERHEPAVLTLVGIDGNAMGVMGAVRRALRKAGWTSEEVDLYLKFSMSGPYEELLAYASALVVDEPSCLSCGDDVVKGDYYCEMCIDDEDEEDEHDD